MTTVLFDSHWQDLLPLTYTRPVASLRVGISTIVEKWNVHLETESKFLTRDYLREKFPPPSKGPALLINGSVLPNEDLIIAIRSLSPGQCLKSDNTILAFQYDGDLEQPLDILNTGNSLEEILFSGNFLQITYPWDIFHLNAEAISNDFRVLTANRKSQKLHESNKLIGPVENLFIESGATILASIINSETGPVYVGKDSTIMEGCMIRGPFSMGEHSVLKMGAKIYGATTLGPWSKAGGEINNSVISGFSNKGHDGFLGNSVIGEWCNLGADTNNSNLKNNYAEVKMWNYPNERFIKTGLQFCGLVMGDHSKCGINTMFNTGTVVGIFANIFGSGFPRNFIPSFSWGGPAGFMTYKLQKAFEVAEKVMARRDMKLEASERKIIEHIFSQTSSFRHWEN